ncbi:MAG: response regulator [Chthoniobacterales bacterium]|nr:response regulator [Chthoniobacterales bacterium]
MASALGFGFQAELFKVDFAMWTRDATTPVPVVFIESENFATSADHEMRKLTCIAAPLRVLMVPVEWDESEGVWASGGLRRQLLTQWQHIVRSYNQVWPRQGVCGVVIGEWRRDNHLRFYANAFDPTGNLLHDTDLILLDRVMPERDLKFVDVVDDAGATFTYAVPLTETGQQLLGQYTDDPKGGFQFRQPEERPLPHERVAVVIAIEKDPALLQRMADMCRRLGYFVQAVDSAESAIDVMQQVTPNLLLLRLNDRFTDVLEWGRNNHPSSLSIILIDDAEIERGIEALKGGAHDYLTVSTDDEVESQLETAVERQRRRDQMS